MPDRTTTLRFGDMARVVVARFIGNNAHLAFFLRAQRCEHLQRARHGIAGCGST
jgi:hypothetical protein